MRHPDDEAVIQARIKAEAAGLREEHIPLRVYFADLIFLLRVGAVAALIVLAGAVLLIV